MGIGDVVSVLCMASMHHSGPKASTAAVQEGLNWKLHHIWADDMYKEVVELEHLEHSCRHRQVLRFDGRS